MLPGRLGAEGYGSRERVYTRKLHEVTQNLVLVSIDDVQQGCSTGSTVVNMDDDTYDAEGSLQTEHHHHLSLISLPSSR